ncbi:MAG: ATP-grasp domain-containing protein [Anaerolineales bacterium]|nr:ATP-grasp domain-containing protein [Anaerolineales bacterium]
MALRLKSQRSELAVQPPTFKAIILYSVMSDWTQDDTLLSDECITRMKRGLSVVGVEATPVAVRRDVAGPLKAFDPREYVVFNWAEGLDGSPNAYDAVPPILEELGFAYSGADAWSLAASLDKAYTKKILLENKIPTPVSKVYDRAVLNGWRRYPALVKPATEHCSFGITRDAVVDTPQQLKERIQYVLDTWHCPALIEDFIDGTEFNVSVWGNGDEAQVLPISAMDYSAFPDYHDRLCTFDAKWNPESEAYRLTAVQCPALLDKTLKRRIERVALATYKALNLRDYGRVDMRVRNGVPYVLDVNANPDITMEGGFARSSRAAGYDYGQMTARILSLASHRMPNGTKA